MSLFHFYFLIFMAILHLNHYRFNARQKFLSANMFEIVPHFLGTALSHSQLYCQNCHRFLTHSRKQSFYDFFFILKPFCQKLSQSNFNDLQFEFFSHSHKQLLVLKKISFYVNVFRCPERNLKWPAFSKIVCPQLQYMYLFSFFEPFRQTLIP